MISRPPFLKPYMQTMHLHTYSFISYIYTQMERLLCFLFKSLPLNFVYTSYYVYVCCCGCGCTHAKAYMWVSEDNLWKSALSLHYIESRSHTECYGQAWQKEPLHGDLSLSHIP